MRKEIALFAAVAAFLTFAMFGAQAMPMAPLKGVAKSADQITPVSGGCGRWRHRGPHGHCRHN